MEKERAIKVPKKELTMGEAWFISRLHPHTGTDAEIALEYGVDEETVRTVRNRKEYKGVRLA